MQQQETTRPFIWILQWLVLLIVMFISLTFADIVTNWKHGFWDVLPSALCGSTGIIIIIIKERRQ